MKGNQVKMKGNTELPIEIWELIAYKTNSYSAMQSLSKTCTTIRDAVVTPFDKVKKEIEELTKEYNNLAYLIPQAQPVTIDDELQFMEITNKMKEIQTTMSVIA